MIPSVLADQPSPARRDLGWQCRHRWLACEGVSVDHELVPVRPDATPERHTIVSDQRVAVQCAQPVLDLEKWCRHDDARIVHIHRDGRVGRAVRAGETRRERERYRRIRQQRRERCARSCGAHQAQRLACHARRESIHAVLCRAHRDAELLVRHRRELRREPVDRAAVLHETSAVECAEPEADAASARGTGRHELRRPHAVEGCRPDHATVRPDSACEQCADESAKVGHCCVHASRRRHTECKGRRLERALVHRPHQRIRHMRLQRRRQLEGARPQSHRLKHRALEITCEWCPTALLEQVADRRNGRIRILRRRAGSVHERGRIEARHSGGQRR